MDPLSITEGVGGLLDLCLKAGFAIKAAREGSKTVGSKIGLVEGEIRGYSKILQLMSSTLQDPSITASFQSTGHVGNHWKSIRALIQDNVLQKVDKPVKILDNTRKHLRLMFAAEEIEAYQRTIRTYRDTMQISLQTIVLWNQVPDRLPSHAIAPSLDDLTELIRTFAMDLKSQMSSVRVLVQDLPAAEDHVRTLERMKNCVGTAVDVVSSASTVLGLDDRASVVAPSELGDSFGTRSHDNVLRWLNNNQTESESAGPSGDGPAGLVSNIPTLAIDDSESDDDLELKQELIEAHLKRGRGLAEKEIVPAPVLGLQQEIRRELLKVYFKQDCWEKVKDLQLDNLKRLEERLAHGTRDMQALQRKWSMMMGAMLGLAITHIKLDDALNAKRYAKKCMKGCKSMGEKGRTRLLDSVKVMASACRANNEVIEAESYSLMYDELKASMGGGGREQGRDKGGIDETNQQPEGPNPGTGSLGDSSQTSRLTSDSFVHVHFVTQNFKGWNIREGILGILDSKLFRLKGCHGGLGPLMPFRPVTMTTCTKRDSSGLVLWERDPKSSPNPKSRFDYHLLSIPDCTIGYNREIWPGTGIWADCQLDKESMATMPVCIIFAFPTTLKPGGGMQHEFGDLLDVIYTYFYREEYFSTPLIFLSLTEDELPAGKMGLYRQPPSNQSCPPWLEGHKGPKRGWFWLHRSIKNPQGILDAFRFIEEKSWAGDYYGPPGSRRKGPS
ncbi:hypothetical protein V8F06_013213 [Rhypophila decipiens]